MSISYATILRQAGLRVNALVGATASALETTYAAALTSASFDSADFPFTSFKDACLAVEGRLATAIADYAVKINGEWRFHPWRRVIATQTANIANKGQIPSTDSSGNPIIGVYGTVFDSSDNEICKELALEDVRIAVRNANSWLKTAVYGYCITGNRIEHTRANVKIDVCTYNRTTQATAIATLTNSILLPDALEEAYVSGIVSLLVRDDAFVAQAAIYRGYFNETLAGIRRGETQLAQAA